MPSASLQHWQNDRMQRLAQMSGHCVAAAALTPLNVYLAEESLRGYAMLLCGHFQGFCRNLYSECAQLLVAQVPLALQPTAQSQFFTELKINSNNPTVE